VPSVAEAKARIVRTELSVREAVFFVEFFMPISSLEA